MATDRFIDFSNYPEQQEVIDIACNYFGLSGEVRYERENVWTVSFAEPMRWIEIIFTPSLKNVDIITRQQDEFVCAVADGLVKLIKRKFPDRIVETESA